MKLNILTLAVMALTILSCNTGKESASEAVEGNSENTNETVISSFSTIENTKWVITTLEGEDISDLENNGQVVYFTLDSKDNRVNGFSGCNTFMGTYEIKDGNSISFSQMASTLMACPDSKINESQVLSVFEMADNYTIQDGKLSLNKAKRAPLAVFKKYEMTNEPIVEIYWKLKTLNGKEVTMADNQEREIYFTLKSKDHQVVGFSGCNTFGGTYSLEEGNRIRFHQMLSTLKACPDVEVNESEFLEIFNLADNYTINGDILNLNVGKRAPFAVFEAVYFD